MTHFPSRRLEQAEHDGSTTLFLSSTDIGAGPREDLHGVLPSAMTHFPTLLNGLLESHPVHFDLLKNTLATCHLLVLAAASTVRMALSNMASRSNFADTRSNACLRSSDATKSFLHSCAGVSNFITIPRISDAILTRRTGIHRVQTRVADVARIQR